jgi:hypothetical protein
MLNRNINYLLILLLTIAAGACSKQKTPEEGPATVMLFNALEDGVSIRANLSGQLAAESTQSCKGPFQTDHSTNSLLCSSRHDAEG